MIHFVLRQKKCICLTDNITTVCMLLSTGNNNSITWIDTKLHNMLFIRIFPNCNWIIYKRFGNDFAILVTKAMPPTTAPGPLK